jgi:hypothetical protein
MSGKRSSFSCEKEVEKLNNQESEISEVLKELGVEQYYHETNNWSVYEIGTMLPFYFS